MKDTLNHETILGNNSSIIIYQSEDGETQLEVKLQEDTVWLTTSQMAELFGRISHVQKLHIWVKTQTKYMKQSCTILM